ncbi:MAG: hypothetical protein ACO3K7_02420 [Candidatus Marinamargulisbacteria bacterium]
MTIESIHDASQHALFQHIDRVINATRINEMQELKKLVSFIDHLIQTLIHQISGGALSEKGARIKLLQLFGLIQHCQIGNHPTIKMQLAKLTRLFETHFKPSKRDPSFTFQSKPIVLASQSIQHYVESIRDSHADPMYSEQPRSLVDIATEPTQMAPPVSTTPKSKKPPKKNAQVALSTHYLANLIQAPVQQRDKEPSDTRKKIPSPHHDPRINFYRLSKSFHKTIQTTI